MLLMMLSFEFDITKSLAQTSSSREQQGQMSIPLVPAWPPVAKVIIGSTFLLLGVSTFAPGFLAAPHHDSYYY